MARKASRYGWIPDSPDPRDVHGGEVDRPTFLSLPKLFSLRPVMPPVYDQGSLGSCTANAVGAAVQYQQIRQGNPEGQQVPSRLFIYFEERVMEGTRGWDAGAMIRDGIKVVASKGAPPETDWPYDVSRFTVTPSARAYADALRFQALSYARPTRTSYNLRRVLAAGRPIVFGFTVFDSFESHQVETTGIVPMPEIDTEEILGGHAVLAVGYKWMSGHLYFEVRNSWGPDWGDHGYFWMPSSYLLDHGLSDDFWDIKAVE